MHELVKAYYGKPLSGTSGNDESCGGCQAVRAMEIILVGIALAWIVTLPLAAAIAWLAADLFRVLT